MQDFRYALKSIIKLTANITFPILLVICNMIAIVLAMMLSLIFGHLDTLFYILLVVANLPFVLLLIAALVSIVLLCATYLYSMIHGIYHIVWKR